MRFKILWIDWQREEAKIEAFGEVRIVALLPCPAHPPTYEFLGVLYRINPKDVTWFSSPPPSDRLLQKNPRLAFASVNGM